MKYSGMAFQMAVLLGLGVFAGSKLDERYGNEKPYFTLALAVLGLVAAFYLSLKDLIFPPKK